MEGKAKWHKEDNKVVIPKIVGSTLREAQSLLESKGLKLGNVKTESNPDYPDGQILRQIQRAYDSIAKGSAIDVVVNKVEKKNTPAPTETQTEVPLKTYNILVTCGGDEEALFDDNAPGDAKITFNVSIADGQGKEDVRKDSYVPSEGRTVRVRFTYEGDLSDDEIKNMISISVSGERKHDASPTLMGINRQ